jgi:hypothetical protein
MARPERNNVDYFPFMCKEGKGIFVIESKYGNDGYATWIKILRHLAVTDYHYLDLSKASDLMFLSSKCKVSEELLIKIIDDLAELGEVEKDLWVDYRIVFSNKFIESIQDAYGKRNNKCISYEGLLLLLHSKGIRKLHQNGNKGGRNPQSIVEYSIVEDTKVKQTIVQFNSFWDTYDKKVNKPKCEKKWLSLSESDRDAIMNNVKLYVKSTPDKKFRKDPLTYLNNRAWEDEIPKSSGGIKYEKWYQPGNVDHIII